jgi:hypothetical protein
MSDDSKNALVTRSGKRIVHNPTHYGRYALQNSTLPGQIRYKTKTARAPIGDDSTVATPLPLWKMPTLPSTPCTNGQMKTRSTSDQITCSMFGLNRRDKYPGFHFCSNCDMWDSSSKISSSRIKRNSYTFKCQAKHESFVYPTDQLVVLYNTKVKKVKQRHIPTYKDFSDSSSEESNQSILLLDNFMNSNTLDLDLLANNDDALPEYENEVIDLSTKFECANNEENDEKVALKLKTKTNSDNELTEHDILKCKYNALLDEFNKILSEFQSVSSQLNIVSEKYSSISNSLENIALKLNDNTNVSESAVVLINKVSIEITNTARLLDNEQRKNRYLQKKYNDLKSSNSTIKTTAELVTQFKQQVSETIISKKMNYSTISKLIVNELFKDDFLKGVVKEKMIDRVREYYRSSIFSPSSILKAMDMAGGQLSMQGIEILRRVETNGKKFNRKSVLPSSGSIKRICKIVDSFTQIKVPFREGMLGTGGEFAQFQPKDVINLMIQSYKLSKISKKRPIKINQAIDAALITTNMHHTTYGLKMADRAAIDPITGRLIYGSKDSSTLQSRNNCFPLMIVLKKETKELFSEFTQIMKDVFNQSTNGPNIIPGLHNPIETAFDSDMSATWKLCGKGGAMKRELHPCHCCAIHDDLIAVPNSEKCSKWCKELHNDEENWKCYHHDILDSKNVNNLRLNLDSLQNEISHVIPNINQIMNVSKMDLKEDPRAMVDINQANDPMSIHFHYKSENISEDTLFGFSNQISDELILRDIIPHGTLESRVMKLKDCLTQEWLIRTITASINHSEKTSDKSFLSLIDFVPCILHLENRTGIKIFSMILREGLQNSLNKSIYPTIRSQQMRIEKFLTDIAEVCNKKIWGTDFRPSSWKVPYDNKEKVIDDITLDNNKTRELCINLKIIIRICICDEDRQAKWILTVNKYVLSMSILRKKDDFSWNDIKNFQYEIDEFFSNYMELVGRNGITNYFHLLGSGHISDYLYYYKNLFDHSQQGWEAFNSLLKVFYFRRTNRGGGRGDGSRVRQIARWMARRIVWLAGIEYNEIKTEMEGHEVTTDSVEISIIHDN